MHINRLVIINCVKYDFKNSNIAINTKKYRYDLDKTYTSLLYNNKLNQCNTQRYYKQAQIDC